MRLIAGRGDDTARGTISDMDVLKNLNYALSFAVEVAAAAALVYGGWHMSGTLITKVLLGVGLPIVVIVIWSMFFAPQADYRLAEPWLTMGKMAIFLAAAYILYRAGKLTLATVLAVTAILNTGLALLWGQR